MSTPLDTSETSSSPKRPGRAPTIVRWFSGLLIVASMLVMARHLPIDTWINAFQDRIEGLGIWGPLAFAAVYAIATVLFVPGSALTLAAGAVFGLGVGTAAVSVGSTVGAALAFLVGRHLLRDKVVRIAARNPRFRAMDRAIGEGGWRIVALLRLSPAVPFNLQNYLYGVTAIRFWPCILTSWGAMLPGTFMYVYLAYVGRRGFEAAAGAESPASVGRWILLVVGLIATVVVTVYITRIAVKALKSHTEIENEVSRDTNVDDAPPVRGWTVGLFAMAVLAIGTVSMAAWSQTSPQTFRNLFRFGPPAVTLVEAHQQKSDAPSFDHSAFNAIVSKHVDADGYVDYAGVGRDAAALDGYIAAIGAAPFQDLGRDEKLALLINAYNAFTLRLILDHWNDGQLASIRDIDKPWDQARWKVGPYTWSLNQLEHEQIRPMFVEPRIHFALVCAAVGCPRLRNEAYVAARLDKQLDDQMRYSHSRDRWYRYDPNSNTVSLTKLYDWYGGDFEQVAGGVLEYVAGYAPDIKKALEAGRRPTVRWLEYDWKLNDKRAKGR